MQGNKKSKIISLILVATIVLAAILVFLIPPLVTQKYDEELIIYNWADYIDSSILADFAEYYEELTGKSIKIVYTNFDTNETMLTEIIKGDSKIDMICPSEYAIEKLLRYDVLEQLDWSIVEQYGESVFAGNINQAISDKIDTVFSGIEVGEATLSMNDYFLPYMWGTLGILYNSDIISREQIEEAGWGILWNSTNIPNVNGKILVKDSIRDTYVAAVMYLRQQNRLPAKYSTMSVEELINCTDIELVELAEEVLKEQKKFIKGYEVDFGKDDMVNKIAYVDLAWSGDAMYAIEEAMDDEGNSFLDYYVPTMEGEGSNIWFDGWVIPKNAKNKTAAHIFMNYLCRPDIAMYNTIEIGYSAAVDNSCFQITDENDPNYEYALDAIAALLEAYEIDPEDTDAVKEFLEEEFFGDERRYPEIKVEDESLGMMRDFGGQNEKIVEMWERVKSYGEDGNWAVLGIIIGVLGAVTLAAVLFLIWKFKKQPKPRRIADKAE